jgi:hypothetical protein
VGEEGEYTLGKSFTEGNGSFGGQTARLPEVAVAMEREWEREERKEERKKEGSICFLVLPLCNLVWCVAFMRSVLRCYLRAVYFVA